VTYFVIVAVIAAIACAVVSISCTTNWRPVSGASLLFLILFCVSTGAGAATYPIMHSISKEHAVGGYHQYLNGSIVSADMEHFKCTRDGPCDHEYSCDYYYTTEYYTDSDGNTHSREELHWHHCPYASEEFSYMVTDTFGNTYDLGDHFFAEKPLPWKRNKSVPTDVPRGVPARWQHAHDSLKRGDSDPVTVQGEYKNFILSSEDTILKAASSNIAQLRKARLLPDHTKNIQSPIHQQYLADKVSFVGFTPSNPAAWQDALMHFDAGLGMTRQGDMHIVAIKASGIPASISPEDYMNALKAYWLNSLGKNALAKNGIALVLAVNDSASQVEWAKAATGMPIGNGVMLQRLSSQLSGLPFTPPAILGSTTARVDPTTHKVTYTPGSGRAAQIVMQEFPFVRACMECKDKNEKGQHSFVDLSDQIPLSTSGRVWGTILLLALIFIGWSWIYNFLVVDVWYLESEDDQRRKADQEVSQLYSAGPAYAVKPRNKRRRKARYEY
jgi:hypothetical protein